MKQAKTLLLVPNGKVSQLGTAPTGGGYGTVEVSRAMQVKTVNARTQGEDRRQRSVREHVESLQTGSPVVIIV